MRKSENIRKHYEKTLMIEANNKRMRNAGFTLKNPIDNVNRTSSQSKNDSALLLATEEAHLEDD